MPPPAACRASPRPTARVCDGAGSPGCVDCRGDRGPRRVGPRRVGSRAEAPARSLRGAMRRYLCRRLRGWAVAAVLACAVPGGPAGRHSPCEVRVGRRGPRRHGRLGRRWGRGARRGDHGRPRTARPARGAGRWRHQGLDDLVRSTAARGEAVGSRARGGEHGAGSGRGDARCGRTALHSGEG